MNKFFALLMTFVGASQSASVAPAVQTMDPSKILFSTPTLANDMAPLDPLTAPRTGGDLTFHEDEWAQNEFLPKAILPEVRRMLIEYKAFEQQNRATHGWRNVYVRKINRTPLVAGQNALAHLQSVLGAKAGAAPIVDSSQGAGRVRGGFTFAIGRNVRLYGYADEGGIPVLGAELGPNPEDAKLVEAFTKLNASDGLVLVDWRQQMVLVSVGADGNIEIWRP